MPIRCLKEPEVVLPGLELKLSWLAVQTLGHKLSTLTMYLKWSDIPSRLIFHKSDCWIFSFNQHEKCILTEGNLVSGLLVGQIPKQTWPARLISKSDRIGTYNFPSRPTSPSPLLHKINKSLAYLNTYLCPPSSVYHPIFLCCSWVWIIVKTTVSHHLYKLNYVTFFVQEWSDVGAGRQLLQSYSSVVVQFTNTEVVK